MQLLSTMAKQIHFYDITVSAQLVEKPGSPQKCVVTHINKLVLRDLDGHYYRISILNLSACWLYSKHTALDSLKWTDTLLYNFMALCVDAWMQKGASIHSNTGAHTKECKRTDTNVLSHKHTSAPENKPSEAIALIIIVFEHLCASAFMHFLFYITLIMEILRFVFQNVNK